MSKIPLPPGYEERPRMTKDEVQYVLDSTLAIHHRVNPQVIQFISEYIDCRSPREAARRCGMHPAEGPQLFRCKDIARAIDGITDLATVKYGYFAEDAVARVKDIMEADPIDCQNADGSWKSRMSEFPHSLRMAIKELKVYNKFDIDPNGIKVVTGEVIEIKFHDRLKASETLASEKGAFKKTSVVEHDIGKRMGDILLSAERRALLATRDVTPDDE